MPAAPRLRIHHILPASQANGPGWRAVIWLQGCTLACPGCFNPGTHANTAGEWIGVEELYQQIKHIIDAGRIPPSPPFERGAREEKCTESPLAPLEKRGGRGGGADLLLPPFFQGGQGGFFPSPQSVPTEKSTSIEGITLSGGEPLQQMAGLISFLTRIRAETHLSVILFSGYTWTEIQAMPQAKRLLPLIDVLLAGRYVAEQRVAHGLLGSGNKTIHFLSNRYTAADLEAVPEAEVILTQNGEIIYSGINPLQEQDSPPGGGSTGS